MVGEGAGAKLHQPPDRRVDRRQQAHLAERAPGQGEVERKEPPGHAVVQVVDPPRLAHGEARADPPAGQQQNLAEGRLRCGFGAWSPLLCFDGGVPARLADEEEREQQPSDVGALVLWFSVLGPRLQQAQSAARR